MEKNWKEINKAKNDTILMNMAINAMAIGPDRLNVQAVVESEETKGIFKEKVKKLYNLYKELHEEKG